MTTEEVQEELFSSDESFDDEAGSESSTDVDAKLAEEDVFDIEFFKCYSALKKKDDKIYDQNVKFFDEEQDSSNDDDDKKDKSEDATQSDRKEFRKAPKMTLLDHQLNLAQDDQLDEVKVDLNKDISKSYYEKELEEIKKSIEKVSENIGSDDDDDLLVVKGSTDNSVQSKPRRKIKDMLDKLEEEEDADLSHLRQIWTDPDKLNDEDKFLRNYIVNKLYLPQNVEDGGHFSKNLDEISDSEVKEDDNRDKKKKKNQIEHHSDEKDFDKLTRIPRNSTKTIRDLVEKKEKKEKRIKVLEKVKKKKNALKEADCEDMIGDLTTRFHYRETEPNDCGLSAEELLMATDEELEKWCKLKDAIAYKSPEEEMKIKREFDSKRNDFELKRKIFKSIYGTPPPEGQQSEQPESSSSSRKKKSKRKRKYSDDIEEQVKQAEDEQPHEKESVQTIDIPKKGKKKHKRGLNHKKFAKTGVAPDRLLAYGLSKNKLKKSKLL